jgi:mannose-6-phosphate isomerase-like protein (cupin superfamily)
MAEATHIESAESAPFNDLNLVGTHIRFSNFEVYHLKGRSGVSKASNPVLHENTAEVCLVLSGKVRVNVQNETHELGPGMAIRFKALHAHRIDIVDTAEFLLIHHNLP